MSKKKNPQILKQVVEFDQYRDTYTGQINKSIEFSGQSHDFFTKVKAEYLATILGSKKYFNNEIDALDVGCGHGLIHPYLLAQDSIKLKISGVDIASSVVDLARTKNPEVAYESYDGMKLPYAENTFDIAFAICVMHHVPSQQWSNFLQEMKRVVKSNGLVVIFEHNPVNPITLKIVKDCPLDKDAILIKSGLMAMMMQQAGLTLVERKYILFTPFDKSFFRKLDRKLGWLPLGAQYYTLARKSV